MSIKLKNGDSFTVDDIVQMAVEISNRRMEEKGISNSEPFCTDEVIGMMKKILSLFFKTSELELKEILSDFIGESTIEIEKRWKDDFSRLDIVRDIRKVLYFLVDVRILEEIQKRSVDPETKKTRVNIKWRFSPKRFMKLVHKYEIDINNLESSF